MSQPIKNPKPWLDQVRWYPYYAGYSSDFAISTLQKYGTESTSLVLDPWNGSGTTTTAAAGAGYSALGIDLNPIAVIIAKGRLVQVEDVPSVRPLAKDICKKFRALIRDESSHDSDPLRRWFVPGSVAALRALERAIFTLLVQFSTTDKSERIEEMTPIGAFFYTAALLASRNLVSRFFCSNPTWLKQRITPAARLRPNADVIENYFLAATEELAGYILTTGAHAKANRIDVKVGKSDNIPLSSSVVDLVLASPPYCTRIDYAVSTAVELSYFGLNAQEMRLLRTSLLGTPAIAEPKGDAVALGTAATSLLGKVVEHPSKASRSYYYKNLYQYFCGLASSIRELSRVLRPSGKSIFVVQDSHYKDLRINLAEILCEMATASGMSLLERYDFPCSNTLAAVNRGSRRYRSDFSSTESVLVFEKGQNGLLTC